MSQSKKIVKWKKESFYFRTKWAVVIFAIGLVFLQTTQSFRGLSHPIGIEKAQLAREMARGNFMQTKVIYPAVINVVSKNRDITTMPELYHAPLWPMIESVFLKLFNADDRGSYQLSSGKYVYGPDRIIVGLSGIFLLLALWINYHLIKRLFSSVVALWVVFTVLCANYYWSMVGSGLAQPLLFFLMSSFLFCLWSALQTEDQKEQTTKLILASLSLCLFCLANWIGIWFLISYFVILVFCFTNKWKHIGFALAIAVIICGWVPIFNFIHTKQPIGLGWIKVYDGLFSVDSQYVLRSLNRVPTNMTWFFLRFLRDFSEIMVNSQKAFGGIILTPLFFLGVLRVKTFEGQTKFWWSVLSLLAVAMVAMVVVGSRDQLIVDPSHVVFLFTPLALAYVLEKWVKPYWLASIQSKWNKKGINEFGWVPYFLVWAITVVPFFYDLSLVLANKVPPYHWPRYMPSAIQQGLPDIKKADNVVVTDQPESVAWYTDRIAIALPKNIAQFKQIERILEKQGHQVEGILITPQLYVDLNLINLMNSYRDWVGFILGGPLTMSGSSGLRQSIELVPKSKELWTYYTGNPIYVLGGYLLYYPNIINVQE